MKKQLLILGGGFAGFWSAMSAIRQSRELKKRESIEITLVNPDNSVTIHPTPKDQSLEGYWFSLDRYLKPSGIHQIYGRAERIDPDGCSVTIQTADRTILFEYDYLILSTGVSLHLPNVQGIGFSFKVDSYSNAQRLGDHLIELAKSGFSGTGSNTIVIVGSEFAGLETVTGIAQKVQAIQAYYSGKVSSFKIILLENEPKVGFRFSENCRKYILDVLAYKDIEIVLNAKIQEIKESSVHLTDGTEISSRTIIWTKGLLASSLTNFFKGERDDLNRLRVDQFLKLPEYGNVIAAGNVANSSSERKRSTLMDCQFAQFEGRWAGHNAINDLFKVPMKKYVHPDYITCPELEDLETEKFNDIGQQVKGQRYNPGAIERDLNRTSIFPWRDVEATIKASYPEFIVS
ncbi:MAG: FAD-dependent oxidoreductase [Sediminicola sp.]